jgi:polar amino acid transport system substrate-binding protein
VKYPITWTFQKSDDTRLRDAIASTLSDMMADGTYKAILDEWGVSAGAISKPAINRLTADQN